MEAIRDLPSEVQWKMAVHQSAYMGKPEGGGIRMGGEDGQRRTYGAAKRKGETVTESQRAKKMRQDANQRMMDRELEEDLQPIHQLPILEGDREDAVGKNDEDRQRLQAREQALGGMGIRRPENGRTCRLLGCQRRREPSQWMNTGGWLSNVHHGNSP